MWRAYVVAANLSPGCSLYARSPDRSMRHLAEVGDRRLYGGLISEAYGPDGYRWTHGFDMDDDEDLVAVGGALQRHPSKRLPDNDGRDYEALIADREHAAL